VKVRCLVHVHSTCSFDGRLTLAEIVDLAIAHGFRAVFLTEHIESCSSSDLQQLIEDCRRLSGPACLLIPGLEIESQCHYFLGMTHPVPTTDDAEARRQLLASGAVAVLAHPHRLKRPLTPEERAELRAIEIWNVKDDGGRAPGYVGYRTWAHWTGPSPRPAPIAGVDLHDREGFRPIGIELDMDGADDRDGVDRLDADTLLRAIRDGRVRICHDHAILAPESFSARTRFQARLIHQLRRLFRTLRLTRLFPRGTPRLVKRVLKG
jgi:PHP domain